MLNALGRRLAAYLCAPAHVHSAAPATPLHLLLASLKIADVILVEGNDRFSIAIKYLTQSTWSHAAMFVGTHIRPGQSAPEPCFIEANVLDGVRIVGVEAFAGSHLRICRAIGLNDDARMRVAAHMFDHLGDQYDLRNIFDLARYLIPTPPVPQRLRRKMLSLGSGDPTRAICSTLVARAFHTLPFPILPMITQTPSEDPECPGCIEEILRVRHSSFFVPRDFDISPYFEVIKPGLAPDFDHRRLRWATEGG